MGDRKAPLAKLRLLFPKLQYCRIFIRRSKPKLLLTPASTVWVLFCFKKNAENSVFQPVGFASRSLSDAETTYSQTEIEALAIVFSCERFKNYVYGLRFMVVTVINRFLNCPHHLAWSHRWSLRLQEFEFELEYEPGMNNIPILSRKSF